MKLFPSARYTLIQEKSTTLKNFTRLNVATCLYFENKHVFKKICMSYPILECKTYSEAKIFRKYILMDGLKTPLV